MDGRREEKERKRHETKVKLGGDGYVQYFIMNDLHK